MALGSVEGRAGFFERPQIQGGWGVAERGGVRLSQGVLATSQFSRGQVLAN